MFRGELPIFTVDEPTPAIFRDRIDIRAIADIFDEPANNRDFSFVEVM